MKQMEYNGKKFEIVTNCFEETEITIFNKRNRFLEFLRIGFPTYTCIGTFGKWYKKSDDRPIYGSLSDDLDQMLAMYVHSKLSDPIEYIKED